MNRTISTLPPADLELYRKALKSRKPMKGLDGFRLKQAKKVARHAALILKKQFGVKKIVLFGSIIHPGLFHSHSDIDIAIWGLKGREYYRAVGILQGLDPDISIDLIAFENATPSLQDVIRREGRES